MSAVTRTLPIYKALALLVLIAVPATAYGLQIRPAQHPHVQRVALVAAAQPVARLVPEQTFGARSTPRLSRAQYLELRNELWAMEDAQNPRVALRAIGSLIAVDPAVASSCHSLLHEIGREAYRKYRSFVTALKYQDDICGSGYLHGVVEERLQHVQDVYGELQTICNGYGDTGLGGKCYHGVGHGLMTYTRNNLPLALNMCDNLASDFAKLRCSEGVFMENFNTDQKIHPSRYLRASDPRYPCADQVPFYKDPCYFYAPIYYLNLHDRDYAAAARWCDGSEGGYAGACVIGLGHRLMQQNLSAPRFTERVCDRLGPGKTADCLDGVVSYWMVNFDSVRQGHVLCGMMLPADRHTCNAAVDKRAWQFAN